MLRKLSTANLAAIALLFTIIAASTSLTDSTITRNAFYLAITFSMTAVIFKRPLTFPRSACYIAIAVLCVGLSQTLWLWRFPASGVLEINKEYLNSAIRLLCGAVLIMTLVPLRDHIGKKSHLVANLLLIAGFFYASGVGLYSHKINPDERLEINTVATMTAYIYMLQSLLTVYVTANMTWRYKSIVIVIEILLSFWVILLTETRAALLCYPVFLLLFFFHWRHCSLKKILLSCVIVVTAAATTYILFSAATERLASTINELSNYQQGNGNSSIGGRISLWKAGIHTIEQNPTGQSESARLEMVTKYIEHHEGGNPEALRNTVYHLHNDFIEAGSLQGISGIIALLLFYLFAALGSIKHSHTKAVLLLLLLPTLVIGMVDTLFIDHRYVTNLTLMLAIYLCLQFSGQNNTDTHVRENHI